MAAKVKLKNLYRYGGSELRSDFLINFSKPRSVYKIILAKDWLHPLVLFWQSRNKKIARFIELQKKLASHKVYELPSYFRLGFTWFFRPPKPTHFLNENKFCSLNLDIIKPNLIEIDILVRLFYLSRTFWHSRYGESQNNSHRILILGFSLYQLRPAAPPKTI